MFNSIKCPNCGQAVLPHLRYCEHCGVDLAVAAVLAAQNFPHQFDFSDDIHIAPEILVPRIGEYMIQSGIITNKELERALEYQQEQASSGKTLLLGQALLELGIIERETLDKVVTTQILELQTALNEINNTLQQRVDERTQELQQTLKRLTELNHLKLNFISNISHELRTPLTHIKGYLDILSDAGLGPLNDAQKDAISVLKKAENRLGTLIEDLIQFSIASRGELRLNLKPIKLDHLLQTTVNGFQQKEIAKDIDLQVRLMENLPTVKVDQEKVGWVIFQLLNNALKFTPKGGCIIAKVSEENGLVKVSVSDTGIGIPEERLEEIFEPFHQLDGSTTRRYGGTGLGLAMARRIIEAHGSQIMVESIPGKGSHFEFSFPSLETGIDNKIDGMKA